MPGQYNLPSRGLVQQNQAAIIEPPRIPRSKFIGSKIRTTSFNQSTLIPFHIEEIYPGDHMSYRTRPYIRMATPLYPLLSQMHVDIFWFYCPIRLVWDNWEKFMGSQKDPTDSISFQIPRIVSKATGYDVASIYDYMGHPTVGQIGAAGTYEHNALPLRVYNLIWNEWFRDQNLQNSVVNNTDDGPDLYTEYGVLQRCKTPDYFTKALPWAQKFTAPSVPISGTAPIIGFGSGTTGSGGAQDIYQTGGSMVNVASQSVEAVTSSPNNASLRIRIDGGTGYPLIFADLAGATGVSINTLRQAWAVQTLLERDARGGTRYVEAIRHKFGVISPDFRLQRPEYIGGGSTPLNVSPIAQTAPTTGVPLGALGGTGVVTGESSASYAATEHGYIMGLINVRSELTYQQGLERLWWRDTRYDFYEPALADMGEQAVLRREIFLKGDNSLDLLVFGYQARWDELRQMHSDVTGIMRSTAAGTTDMWHTGQKFTAAPTLGDTFVKDVADMARILAAGSSASGQQFFGDILINRTAVRPMPTYGTPATLGRF